jgi:hypothetical protein
MAVPVVSLSPTALAFGQQVIYTTSTQQTTTLTNTGLGLLSSLGILINGTNASEFVMQTNTCGNTVAPGANCSIGVIFTPQATGSRSASLVFQDNANDSPQTVSLTGTGTLPPTPPGTYYVQVNALSGNDEHVLTIFVTVQ